MSLSKKEKISILFIAGLITMGLLLPAIHQPEQYHNFADQRAWLNIPHFADVVSNLIFVWVGVAGLVRLRRGVSLDRVTQQSLTVFFIGMLLTAFGSSYYHWSPDSQTLLLDRLPMTIAFAGAIGA